MAPKRKAIASTISAAAGKSEAAAAPEAADSKPRKRLSKASASKALPAAELPEKPVAAADDPSPVEPEEPKSNKRTSKARAPKAPEGPFWDPSLRPPPLPADVPAVRILSWNVAGLRALLKKTKEVQAGTREEHIPTLWDLVQAENADVLCLQEIKLQEDHCTAVLEDLGFPDSWHITWNCSMDKKGYSGTAILSRAAPISTSCGLGIKEHDGEGRVLTLETEKFHIVNCYTPNSGDGLKRLQYRTEHWDKEFATYLKRLEASGKPVILTGDLNCAPEPIDIHEPKRNLKSAGFTPEERASFAANLLENGFVDVFRRQYPEHVSYTYWGYRFNLRAKNKGWRLDHFLVSERLLPSVHDCYHLHHIKGSDHCPLGLVVKL